MCSASTLRPAGHAARYRRRHHDRRRARVRISHCGMSAETPEHFVGVFANATDQLSVLSCRFRRLRCRYPRARHAATNSKPTAMTIELGTRKGKSRTRRDRLSRVRLSVPDNAQCRSRGHCSAFFSTIDPFGTPSSAADRSIIGDNFVDLPGPAAVRQRHSTAGGDRCRGRSLPDIGQPGAVCQPLLYRQSGYPARSAKSAATCSQPLMRKPDFLGPIAIQIGDCRRRDKTVVICQDRRQQYALSEPSTASCASTPCDLTVEETPSKVSSGWAASPSSAPAWLPRCFQATALAALVSGVFLTQWQAEPRSPPMTAVSARPASRCSGSGSADCRQPYRSTWTVGHFRGRDRRAA